MTIYHHVANKDAIVDGMVDAVFAEIELPEPDDNWRTGVERRARSARDTMVRHRWAPHSWTRGLRRVRRPFVITMR